MTGELTLRRGDVVLSELGAIGGRTIHKRRPFVIVSPDEINVDEFTYIVAPLTTGHHPYRFRVPCEFAGRKGHVVLDQLFTLSASEAGARIGRLKSAALSAALATLREMFAD